jgi:thiamine-monophosphate kinase
MYSEDKLIKRVIAALPSEKRVPSPFARRKGLRLGVGDDAAVLHGSGHADLVFSCDAFIEGVHFLPGKTPADSAGYKSLARATSDLAAMGAVPTFFFLTLALPASRTGAWLDKFLQGMAKAARQLGIRLAGGDTTKFPKVMLSVTVVGEVQPGHAITRAGARPGDLIYVSGALGGAQLGLEVLQRGFGAKPQYRRSLQPHLYPQIRLELGAWLARHRLASAMMDLSDGLSTDLSRLCAASKVGARLMEARIPCVQVPNALAASRLNLNPFELALHGGEDYELLFTVPREKRPQLSKAPGFKHLSEIGEITPGKRVVLADSAGRSRPLTPAGWDPFRRN